MQVRKTVVLRGANTSGLRCRATTDWDRHSGGARISGCPELAEFNQCCSDVCHLGHQCFEMRQNARFEVAGFQLALSD